jgi:hypothetical protein
MANEWDTLLLLSVLETECCSYLFRYRAEYASILIVIERKPV